MRALNIAATGMQAQQLNVEVISNNIANMSTVGFKRLRPEFQDLLYQDLRRVGSQSSDQGQVVPSGLQIGVGVRTAATYRINEQGSLLLTDNQLDIAIQGEGMFRVELPNGEIAYTRDGSFQLSPEGQIVTADGFLVQPAIAVPQNAVSVTINASGEVLAKLDNQIELQNLGRLDLAVFPNMAGLESIGNNLLTETPASGAEIAANPGEPGFGTLLQGFLESSNVNPVTEITALITAQRAYEMNSKVIEAGDQMMQTVTRLR
ncbi:flagellar basal-body rod protein FlgG [Oceanibaculum pacificum]|uniref:Flagellar basal-body rod protein FlgG n=1 Tax=Oceanibaculum pacificum TaxID=580166 RepID=A0A154W3Z6_9PROT|nr:flagellar basal-body rod protein FlgG [Oceanibaculum pacificum]KZD08131.1 flagellar basal-body rod protein FlgG [Oceanibaculum pacificum]